MGSAVSPEPFYLTDRQRAVHESLRLHASSLARMYLGALRALSDESNPEYCAQAAHSMRELVEKLPRDAVSPVESLSERVKRLEGRFMELQLERRSGAEGKMVALEEPLLSFFDDLEKFFRQFHEERPQRIDQAVQAIRSLDPSGHSLPPVLERKLATDWHRSHGYFEKLSHHNVSDQDTGAGILAARVAEIEAIILALLWPRTTEEYTELDALIREGEEGTPDFEMVSRVVPLLHRGDAAKYFFLHLSSPTWIPALAEAGLLEPPKPVFRDGGVFFPMSGATQYLVRVASTDPEAVVAAFCRMQTDNCRAHEDCADAALAMPAASAARLVPKLQEWLAAPYQLLLLWKVGSVMSHLADGGETAAAMRVARRALSLDSPAGLGRRDSFDYQDVLRDNIPDLVRAAGMDALELLCSLLDQAILLEVAGATIPGDHSEYWRPSVDDRDNDVDRGLRYTLSGAVRDATLALAIGPAPVSDILETLERWRWYFLQRLSLHVLRLAKVQFGLVRERLMRRELFDTRQVRPEYQLLLKEHFSDLRAADRGLLLAWMTEEHEGDVDNERSRQRTRFQQYSWLTVVERDLDVDLRDRLLQLREEFGPLPDLGAFPSPVAFAAGPASPYGTSELLELPVAEVIERLDTWQPTGEWGEPSREGLGHALSSAVEKSPGTFSLRAGDFEKLHKTYVRALLQGLDSAVHNGGVISWQAVIDLCAWSVFEAERDNDTAQSALEDDPGLVWTRREIAGLLESGLRHDQPDKTLREPIWRVLEGLCADADPPELQRSEDGQRWWDAAANSVRGVALLAAVYYGVWVMKRLSACGEDWTGFTSVPELASCLEDRLNAVREPSLAVHSVFGRAMTLLAALDRGWVEAHADQVFPSGKTARKRWRAAFDSYVVFCRPCEALLEIMTPHYRSAIAAVAGKPRTASTGGHMSPDHHLVAHLMTFYWHGSLDLGPDGLVATFFAKAPVGYREDALLFLGRSLREQPEAIGGDVLERLQSLWNHRASALQHEKDKTELSAFGPWYSSGLFDETWSLERLHEALLGAGSVEGSREVVEQLAAQVDARPLEVLACIDLLVKGQNKNHLIHITMERIIDIMERILAGAPGSEVLAATARLADKLLAMGYQEFRGIARRASYGET